MRGEEMIKIHKALLNMGSALESWENVVLFSDHEREMKEKDAVLDAWHSVFGTTQLSHAQARLEQAEKTVVALTDWKAAWETENAAVVKAEKEIATLTADRDWYKKALEELRDEHNG